MNEPEILSDPRAALDLGRVLGQRRAFVALGGRCSAAHAELLRRVRDEKLYLAIAPSWRAFCGSHLAISRRHADYLIGLLKRFGPIYFELSQLVGLSVKQYLAIEPAVREQNLVIDGAAISVIPENAPKILEAIGHLLNQSQPRDRRPAPAPAAETVRTRIADLAVRGRAIANQLVDLYHSSSSPRDRELILEVATELRMILMQPGID
jgi:hypothetical protein